MNEWYALVNDLETAVPPLEEEARRRILQRVQRHRRKKLRVALLAAAVLLLTACGVALARFSGWFWPVAEDYRDPAASEALFARMGQVLDQSQTVDGKTMTLHGALYDGEILMLALSGETGKPEEAHICPTRAQYTRDIQALPDWEGLSREERELWLARYDEEARSSSTQAQILRWENLILLRRELPHRDEPRELAVRLETEAGPYEFVFTLEPRAVRRTVTGAAPVTLGEREMTLTAISVTPFTVTVQLEGTGRAPEDLWITGLDLGEGRQFHSSSHSCRMEHDDVTWQATLTTGPADRILNPEEVTGIYVGEERISLDLLP